MSRPWSPPRTTPVRPVRATACGWPCRRWPPLLDRLAARGESLRAHTARLVALLDDYGAPELTAAVAEALARDALGAGAITHILETRRRQRRQKPPVALALPDRPGVRDLDVTSHPLEAYDALTRSDPDDPA